MKPRVHCGRRCLVVTLIVVFLLPPLPAHSSDGIGCASAEDLGAPLTAYKLIAALRGTTEHAERVADAIEAFEINVHLLSDERFEEMHRDVGGTHSPTAFAYGEAVYLRASSPTLLCDLLHEGVHALDYLTGVAMTRRRMELRAYLRDREFQIAVGAEPQFETVLDVFVFVLSNF